MSGVDVTRGGSERQNRELAVSFRFVPFISGKEIVEQTRRTSYINSSYYYR